MKIEVANGRAYVYTPYNPDFTNAIKGIGGKNGKQSSDAERPLKQRSAQSGRFMKDAYTGTPTRYPTIHPP